MLNWKHFTIIIVLIAIVTIGVGTKMHPQYNLKTPVEGMSEEKKEREIKPDNSNELTNEIISEKKNKQKTKSGGQEEKENPHNKEELTKINNENDDSELPMDTKASDSLANSMEKEPIAPTYNANDDRESSFDHYSNSESFELPIVP